MQLLKFVRSSVLFFCFFFLVYQSVSTTSLLAFCHDYDRSVIIDGRCHRVLLSFIVVIAVVL